MTYARARPTVLIPWAEEHQVAILENALQRWSWAREAFKHMWQYDCPHVIDAGGYSVMSRFVTRSGDLTSDVSRIDVQRELVTDYPFYPWTLEEYHEWLCEYDDEFEWATPMDYAVGPLFDDIWSPRGRIERTFETTVAHFDLLDDDPRYEVLPVLQGRSVDEYVAFYERLEDHGIPTDYIGLGSIQQIGDQMDVVEVEAEVRDRIDADAIHGFGIKVDGFRNGAEFETADSQAWAYHPTNGRVVLDVGHRLRRVDGVDDDYIRKVFSFKHYYSYVTRLHQGEPAVEPDVEVNDEESDDELLAKLYAYKDAST